jgi:tryptophan 2,3-dioxygenase
MALLFHHLAGHFAVMETMTTRDYLAFRDKLFPASGFQSSGLREIEILLGLAESDRVPLGQEGGYLEALRSTDGSASNAYRRVVARLQDRPTLREAVDEWLYRTPIEGSTPDRPGDAERVGRFVDAYCDAHRREVEGQKQLAHFDGQRADDAARIDERYSQEVESARRFLLAEDAPAEERPRRSRIRVAVLFIESYRELPLLAWPREALDGIVALEQAFVIFRQRHARMVERVIGRRVGTGGSSGVDYLDRTALAYRVFEDLWALRTFQIQPAANPEPLAPEFYAFRNG